VPHDPSEIILCTDLLYFKHLLLLSMLITVVHIFFRILWWIENSKEQHLSEI